MDLTSSGSKGMGVDELCTRDCRSNTNLECACVYATSFLVNSSSSNVGYREVIVRNACIGYRCSGTRCDITRCTIFAGRDLEDALVAEKTKIEKPVNGGRTKEIQIVDGYRNPLMLVHMMVPQSLPVPRDIAG